MKTPIEAADLVGQKVRVNDGATEVSVIAYAARPTYLIEFPDGTRQIRAASEFEYEPPVELPTEPTLGWVDGDWQGGPRLAVWLRGGDKWLKPVDSDGDNALSYVPGVTAFTPATAVPQSAIEGLADALTAWQRDARSGLAVDVAQFLNQVHRANGGDLR